jgi:3,4-dihydroxy 2-butanone 4-phosphate synthase/GTP cyclohydrolase II
MPNTPDTPRTPLTPVPRPHDAALSTIEEALEDIRAGKMVILVDDEDRENEGDLCIAAEAATPEAINFMAVHGRGLICLAMTESQMRKLRLPMMVPDHENTAFHGTAFTVSIEAREGVSTGISAAVTSSRFEPARAGCSGGPVRPRARWIWRDWPDSGPPA